VGSLGSEVPNREEDSNTDQKDHDYDYYYFTQFALLGFQGLLGCSRCVHRYILKNKNNNWLLIFEGIVTLKIAQQKDK